MEKWKRRWKNREEIRNVNRRGWNQTRNQHAPSACMHLYSTLSLTRKVNIHRGAPWHKIQALRFYVEAETSHESKFLRNMYIPVLLFHHVITESDPIVYDFIKYAR